MSSGKIQILWVKAKKKMSDHWKFVMKLEQAVNRWWKLAGRIHDREVLCVNPGRGLQ